MNTAEYSRWATDLVLAMSRENKWLRQYIQADAPYTAVGAEVRASFAIPNGTSEMATRDCTPAMHAVDWAEVAAVWNELEKES